MNLKDILRTLFNIRVERESLPPGDKPPVGSNIVWESLRMRLRYPISNEQWNWFREQGWRTVDMRFERRNYLCVPDRAVLRLLNAEKREREALYRQLLNAARVQAKSVPVGNRTELRLPLDPQMETEDAEYLSDMR